MNSIRRIPIVSWRCAVVTAARTLASFIALLAPFASSAAPDSTHAQLVSRGAYLSNAGGCVECHTAKGGKPFAGGLYMDTPFGPISTPNITPDKTTGIGSMSDDAFYRVMHEGIGRHGEYLYPVMPFPWYTTVTRDDVMAIKAFLFEQPAVNQPRPPNKLAFPFSVRKSMAAWRVAFFKPGTFAANPAVSDEINRGAYLVNGLAHCGECHNSRPVTGTSKWRGSLQGGVIDNWYAPNITSDVRDGIGGWSNTEIASYLKTGSVPGKGIAVGPMAETVHSLSKLSDADLLAIAAYLKTTPPKQDTAQKLPLFAGRDARGGDTYLNFCASCHGIDGKGLTNVIPPLDGNGAVSAKGPQNVINVVLGGLEARQRYAPMPAIGAAMSDGDIADVANYVRQNWGNAAPATATPGMVAEARKTIDTLMTAGPLGGCPAIGSPAVAKLLANDGNGITRTLGGMDESNMLQRTQQMVASVRKAAPGVGNADVINGLTSAYCGVVRGESSLDANQKALRLGNFSQLVFMAATGPIAR